MKDVNPPRAAYRKEFPQCQYCELNTATDLHEITPGPAREAALSKRATWLHLCRECHSELQGRPVELGCAVKLLEDPEHFDLSIVNEVRGRSSKAITLADVRRYLKLA